MFFVCVCVYQSNKIEATHIFPRWLYEFFNKTPL